MRKILLKAKPFCNDLHFFLFGIVLLQMALKAHFFFIFLAIYLIFIFKKTKYLFALIILLLIIFINLFLAYKRLEPLAKGSYKNEYEVIEVMDSYIVLKSSTKILVYYDKKDVLPGDIICASLKISDLKEASFRGDFDEKTYYNSKGITNKGKIESFEKIREKWTIARFRVCLMNYYEKMLGEKTFTYVKALFFGRSELDKDIKKAYSLLYITHILAISGFHILFFYNTLLFIFQKVLKIRGESLSIGIIGLYVIFIGFPSSCLRAFLFLWIAKMNQKGKDKYTKLDILSMSYIILCVCFPLRMFQQSFILSFIISFFLIFMNEFLSERSKIKKGVKTSFICVFSILPFLINQTNQFSILGILFSYGIGVLFSKGVFHFLFIILVLPLPSYEPCFVLFDKGLLALSKYTFPIRMRNLNIVLMSIYYLIFIFFLKGIIRKKVRKSILCGFTFLLFILAFRLTNPYYKITIINVGQGDSILIEFPHDQANILIDSFNNNVNYLKSIGINRLDYLILSHFDQDHINSIDELIQECHVKKILYSAFEDEKKIESIQISKKKIKSGDSFIIKNCEFEVLGPIKDLKNANSNSVVLQFKMNNHRIMLTGDMTKEEEYTLIEKYKTKLQSDILKVGHHGSNSSSSLEFLNYVKPNISIISVGKDNLYNLPDKEVLDRLKMFSKVYQTSIHGNIEIILEEKLRVVCFNSRLYHFK